MHQPPSGRVALRDFGKIPMSDGEGQGSGDHHPRSTCFSEAAGNGSCSKPTWRCWGSGGEAVNYTDVISD